MKSTSNYGVYCRSVYAGAGSHPTLLMEGSQAVCEAHIAHLADEYGKKHDFRVEKAGAHQVTIVDQGARWTYPSKQIFVAPV